MASKMPPILNILASKAKCDYTRQSLPYMRFVIQQSSVEEREEFHKCLIQMTYSKFLETAYWAIIRAAVLELYPGCHRCAKRPASFIHHRNYLVHGREHDHLEALVGLCGECHQREHDLLPEMEAEEREYHAMGPNYARLANSSGGGLRPIVEYVLNIDETLKSGNHKKN